MQAEAIRAMIAGDAPMVLDGGLGSELADRGYDLSSSLWSAQLVDSCPRAIIDIHRAYLDAGARCITSASYQASIPGLVAAGYDVAAIETFFVETVAIARLARHEFLEDNPAINYHPLVAASVGPYGAYLADGSEYRGNYGVDDATLQDFHQQRLRWLDAAGADLLACETIPDLREARVLAELLKSTSTPCWVSFCCTDAEHLHDGSSLAEAVALFTKLPSLIAIGSNCIDPGIVGDLLTNLRGLVGDLAIVVYPNSGAQYDAERKCWHGQETSQQWSNQALEWYHAGATLIGGCCRIGPGHIRQLAKREVWHS